MCSCGVSVPEILRSIVLFIGKYQLHTIFLALRCFTWVTHVLRGLQRWGLMPPYTLNDKRRRPRWDIPAAVRVQFFKSVIRKNYFAQRGFNEAVEQPHQGLEHLAINRLSVLHKRKKSGGKVYVYPKHQKCGLVF